MASGDETSTSVIKDLVADFINCDDGTLTEAYKAEPTKPDVGMLMASYSTVFGNTPSDPADATITYGSGPSINNENIYLLVKDGNQEKWDPFTWYLYDISSWNGTDTINLTGFWPANGSISHVSIFACGPTQTPDGGVTVGLLGMAIAAMGFVARKMR